MHERYIIPMILMLVVAYLLYSDRRLLYLMVAYTFPILLNCLCSFYYSQFHDYALYWDERLVFWCSIVNVLMFAYFTYLAVKIMICGKLTGDAFIEEPKLIAKPKSDTVSNNMNELFKAKEDNDRVEVTNTAKKGAND